MTDPVVSIITPVYNHERFIAESIQSVINQDFALWEMLIVNDGSTDRTAEIAAGFSALDGRIKLFNRQNAGIMRLAENYNFALQQARGKYIAILEGDDLWQFDKLSRQVALMENDSEAVMAWSPAMQVNIDQSRVFEVNPFTNPNEIKLFANNPTGSILDILFFRNCIPALTVLIRKDVLLEVGGFRQGYGLPLVDIPTWQALAAKGRFCYDPVATGRWRVYPGQTTKTMLVAMYEGFYKLSKDNFNAFSLLPHLQYNATLLQIEHHFSRMMIVAYAREGRYLLIKKQFRQARRCYRRAICARGGEWVWKLRAFTGLIFSWLHLDVEWLAKALNRPSYKN